jgi:hypothetical protein
MIFEPDLYGMRNYGYAVHEVLLDADQHKDWSEDEDHLFFTRGTVISDASVMYALDYGLTPIFVGCGWDGTTLTPSLMQEALFVGCRGPLTQEELAVCGVDAPIVHDPLHDLPRMVGASQPNGVAMGVIHIYDNLDYSEDDRRDLRSDTLDTPVVKNKRDILELIGRISGARFVLSGSLAVAMTAHAYKVPFAALNTGYIDCETKWEDWFAAEGFGDLLFVEDVLEGRRWYNKIFRTGENNE